MPGQDSHHLAHGNASHSQPPEIIQRSLFGEILDWMLAPLLLLWPMSIAITYLVAKSIANQPFDRALEDHVLVLAQQVKDIDGKVVAQLSNAARDILRADELDTVYFQVRDEQGDLVDGSPELPLPADEEKPQPGVVSLRTDSLRGQEIRVAYSYITLNQHLASGTEKRASSLALVQVAESLDKRAALANEIIKGVILPQFVILPLALALVWFALTRGLSPLAELQYRIRARRPDDLSPIDSRQVPEEIAPLVHSLNDMLDRLGQTLELQKRFIADAAHQMKTPLAGMRMQSELALRETDQAEIQRSLLQLSKSSEAATRLVNQLLTLARAENQTSTTGPLTPLDLNELARTAVQDWIPTSFSYHIDMGFEQADGDVIVLGNALMLKELLNNLIDNALHYTPKGHSVTVRTRLGTHQRLGVLEVEDNGPGIPVSERSRVFERFYRILGSNVGGSGLGLSIVREIAQQHAAQIEILSNSRNQDPRFPGCVFRISFPLHIPPSELE